MDLYLLFAFIIGGTVGWIIDTLDRSIDRKQFVEGSAFHIPFLPIYGFGAVLLIAGRPFFPSELFLDFLVVGILLASLEYIGGVFSTHVLKRRLWNYKTKWNLQGHTDPWHAMLWGVLGMLFLQIEPSLFQFYHVFTK